MKLTKEALVRIIKQEIKALEEQDDELAGVVSDDILNAADEVATDLKELPALQKAIEDAAFKIARQKVGSDKAAAVAKTIEPLIRTKFAETE